MSVTLQLVTLVVFAFFAGHLINRYASRYIPVSGAEYLVIGALIGPQLPPRLLTDDSLTQMEPLVSLLLGLSGFLVGLQMRRRADRSRIRVVGFLVALSTLGLLTLVFASVLASLTSIGGQALWRRPLLSIWGFGVELWISREQLGPAVVLASAATVTFSNVLSRSGGKLDAIPAYRLLRSCSLSGQWVAIAATAVMLGWMRSTGSSPDWDYELNAATWFAGALLLGIVFGVCFTLFIGHEQSTSRIFLATVGTVTFGAGVGVELGVSPMFVNLVSGLTVALTSRHQDNLQGELQRLQHPIFVLFLVLIGALWVPPAEPWLWAFPAVYLFARWAARMVLPGLWTRLLTRIDPARVGVGLLSQGTLAVAVAADYAMQVSEAAGLVLTTVVVGTLAFDLFAQGSLKRYLIDAETEHGQTDVPVFGEGGTAA